MKGVIQKLGKDFFIEIPDELLASTGMKVGDTVRVSVEDNRLILEKFQGDSQPESWDDFFENEESTSSDFMSERDKDL